MEKFFNFNSVVVFGVSTAIYNLAIGVIYNLQQLNYTGKIFAIGSKPGDANGVPIQTSLDDIEDDIELAVLVIPAPAIPDIMEKCGKKGIHRVIIESSGFSEFTGDNKENDNRLLEIAEKYDMRFIGPNCIGTVNVPGKINLDFASNGLVPREGPIGIIAQSGGVTLWFAGICAKYGLGMSLAASIGNKLNVNEADLLEYYLSSDNVGTVLCYLESISDGPRLTQIAQNSTKPVVIYKSNTDPSSAEIAKSHTTAILSDNKVVDQAFKQAGIWRVNDTIELDITMRALQLKPCKGNNIFIVARSGGHAVMAADAAARHGFNLLKPPPEFYKKLETIIPTTRILRQNPLDIGDVFAFNQQEIIKEVLKLDNLDALIFLYMVTQREDIFITDEFLSGFSSLAKEADIPVLMGFFRQDQSAGSYVSSFDIPIFETPDNAVRALAINRDCFKQKKIASRKIAPSFVELNTQKAASILKTYQSDCVSPSDSLLIAETAGIALPPWKKVETDEELIEAAHELKFPLVLKLDEPDISHKSDQGFVILNIRNNEDLIAAYKKITRKYNSLTGLKKASLLLMHQIESGLEIIIGAKHDDTFGPVVMFGLGGIMVELLNKVAMRICPVDEIMALEMINQVQGSQLLDGYRGMPPVDKKAIADIIMRTAKLIEIPQIKEIDFNPVIASPEGAVAVDARIVLKSDS